MRRHWQWFGLGLFAVALCCVALVQGQQATPPAGGEATSDLPPVPKGVEVLARGPVHEAFASLTAEPAPTKLPKTASDLPLIALLGTLCCGLSLMAMTIRVISSRFAR